MSEPASNSSSAPGFPFASNSSSSHGFPLASNSSSSHGLPFASNSLPARGSAFTAGADRADGRVPWPSAHRRSAHDGAESDGRHLRAVPPEVPRGRGDGNAEAGVTAAFRSEVVSRLRRFSVLHTRHVWERRRRDPLSPHGIALFYLERGVPAPQQLRTATRIFLADDEADDLPMLLYGLARHAHEGYQADPGFDPRTRMANKCDSMSADAVFTGIGVCTLDTPFGTWADAQRQATNEFDLPGRCYARLIDGTRLLLDRGGRKQFNGLTVESSVDDANTRYGVPSMQWRWNPELAEIEPHDPAYHVWRWMSELGRIVDAGSQPR
ncbi:hypothetical protein [Dactylosporangium sp. NPDC000521]|uniref:hypothetical protein n=1 Tax=Dactylosporangium sp. NPDC000521 TaxID=3363975 RepID=UPI0036AA0C81